MKMSWWCAALCVFAFGSLAPAEDKKENKLPEAVQTALEKAESLELYSLNGETNVRDGWHNTKVLGQTTVKGDDAKKIAAAVVKSVGEGRVGAKCFIPRHGVRVTHDGKTYDLVICFECRWVYVYTDKNENPQRVTTSTSAQELLNQILSDAKVPLAKPEK
ncbi:Uncharacterized protein OS=Pirellula staleyi (strain ATCC 27377 / DSM 6068 / ICPB 4128) GN=Psta_0497 PE=4 SV=1 [Gemmata massiliana]|uniref:Uncharacterized protein n=1 Tax=Gemmata massiliana TaxID=1210884 RepID=A0A6P2CSS8_9BACT|nr:hypothetical protein [Gemmata massiliana]VTR91989.1 Uncharacterized protein OS=Pirellula staleyi (strain ATCC 27377 / DSM 6068 / ICPB 4128) GN=Psta_0497 PE=4 SV=1 [Gemmata massiliana]